jgi:hypothetical protein
MALEFKKDVRNEMSPSLLQGEDEEEVISHLTIFCRHSFAQNDVRAHSATRIRRISKTGS